MPSLQARRLLAAVSFAAPLLCAAQPAGGPPGAGTVVTLSSPSAAAERQFADAYRQRGFTVTESSTVTRTQTSGGWKPDTASSPMLTTDPATDTTATVYIAVARKPGAAASDEVARCEALMRGVAGTCKVAVEVGSAH